MIISSRNIDTIIKMLSETKTPEELFNPYRDVCDIHDKENAPEIRRINLRILLEAYSKIKPKMIWVFEAPSFMGARRSGAPFVNEGMFSEIETLLGIQERFKKATVTDAKTALTSRIAWNVVGNLKQIPMIWESIPFHPHKKNNPMSNRKPDKSEILNYKHFIDYITKFIRPNVTISVGRTAEEILNLLNIPNTYVRHPAQGGARKFQEQIKNLTPRN